jgi:predicted nucleic acid-binding protein
VKAGLYLDTSALVKLYVAEPETEKLAAYVTRQPGPLPYTSLHELELTHALERRAADGDLPRADVARVYTLIEKDLADGTLFRPEFAWESAFSKANYLVRRHKNLRSLDSLHLGCALDLNCSKFVTFDQRQARVATAEKFVLWPPGI